MIALRILRSRILVICVLIVLSAVPPTRADYAPDELLVRFKPDVSALDSKNLHAKQKAVLLEKLDKVRVHRIKLPPGLSVEKAIEAYRKNPNVEYAGPNHILRLDYSPNDQHYVDDWQWGLYSPGAVRRDIHAPEAWDITTGSSDIIIAVVDTGARSYHEDLQGAGPGPKILPGYNAVANSTNTNDTNGHGTFVSGIAAADTDNYIGMAGVAWNARILPIKVIEGEFGYEADAAEGIIWAVDNGAKVLNMSFGGYDDVPVMEQAIDYAWSNGCVSVCSSGNDSINELHYPSAYTNALAVGASDEYDQRWDDFFLGGSNFGPWLDVMAPGTNILSSYIEEDWVFDLGYYTLGTGTSASAPFVSGIAALLWSEHPNWTNYQIVQQIISTCDDIGATGWDIETGAGRVNAFKALVLAPQTVGSIKTMKTLSNGMRATMSGAVVTCKPGRLTDRIYIEDGNKTSGILIYSASNPPIMNEGSRVDVTGTLGEFDGERALLNPGFSNVVSGLEIGPVSMPGRMVGGIQIGDYQLGVEEGEGLNNIGLLIRCSGVVTDKDFTHFYIDDGSRLDDDSGSLGLRVAWGGSKPAIGKYVAVTGISGCEIPSGTTLRIRTLRPRMASDIVVLK
ncbi:MAG: S8 family serine peptidase [Armatimonadota bacterium]|nr:S8 family serine peptidase [Armatimonadota bacterium]